MRVLHVVRPAAGGMLRHVQLLTQRLAATGMVVAISAPATLLAQLQPVVTERKAGVAPLGLQFYPLNWERALWRRPWQLGRVRRQIGEAIRTFRPDIVHAHGLEGAWAAGAMAQRAHVPICVTLHNQLPGRCLRYLALRLIPADSGVILVSPAMASSWPGARHARVIVNGVDLPAGLPPAAPPSLAHDGAAGAGALRIAVLSRLAPEKGLDLLVDSLVGWDQLARPVAVRVAGDGPAAAALRRRLATTNTQDRIKLLGRLARPAVQELLNWCELVLLPSRTEGLPLAVLEAMAAGRAVVASRVGGIPWVVEDGVTGLLFEPNSVSALRTALERVWGLRQDLAQMGWRGYKRVVERYTLDAMVQQTEQYYREILAGGRGGSGRAGHRSRRVRGA